ncbi:MAG: DUF1329 domain-containing protein [Deltaproteobacteria bacterium]|nr:DUF1329 domain-containing protein [Deltaproteobacteria bacterium]
MRRKQAMRLILSAASLVLALPLLARGAEPKRINPETYTFTWAEFEKHKKALDDPRPVLKEFGLKQILPASVYSHLVAEPEDMKKAWSELVGFKAPDVVGKIAPEIKPGKYTYKDLSQHPGFKQLMTPDLYNRIKPGAPPHSGNIPEFEIIPTREYYWSLGISEMTKKNLGKTKLDDKGYVIGSTWAGGYPFPRPSGPFKAQQIMANVEKRYLSFGHEVWLVNYGLGFNKNLKIDFAGIDTVRRMSLAGRAVFPPYGTYDKRAEELGETGTALVVFETPRDMAGLGLEQIYYRDPLKPDLNLMYIPSFRRVKKMSATDTQDAIGGQDLIYEDQEGWGQKLSPQRYPYKMEIIEEREYLVMAPTIDGAEYVSSKGNYEFRNVRLERRPLYVVKLTQQDKNYVYGSRILYIDQENFNFYHIANYDQKGRLYRTFDLNPGWHPEMGHMSWFGAFAHFRDHIDLHSNVIMGAAIPAAWDREDIKLEGRKGLK